MQTMIRLAEFVFNNAVLLSVILVAALFFMFHVKQLFQELLLNMKLDVKQRVMRNLERIPFRYARLFLRKRMVVIMVPFVVVAAIFITATWNPIHFEHHMASIDSEEDIIRVHADFDERFYGFHIFEADGKVADASLMRHFRMMEPKLHMGIDTVAHNDEYILSLSSRGIEITSVDGSEINHHGYLEYEDKRNDELHQLHGVVIDDGRLVVLGTIKEDIPLGASDEIYCEEEFVTLVRIYDIEDDFTLVDTYRMSGKVTDAAYADGVLSLVTKQYLPFGYDKFSVGDSLPWIAQGDASPTTQSYDSIHYIERVEPNSFTSFHAIDLEREAHDFRTLLMDFQSEVRIMDNAFYIAADHYRFHKITDGMRLSDPVESIDTTLTKFRIDSFGTIRHQVTLSLPGALSFSKGLQVADERILLLTTDDDNQTLFKLEKNLTHATIEHELPAHIHVNDLFYHDGIAYLSCYTEDGRETRMYAIGSHSIEFLSIHEGILLTEAVIPRTGSPLFITLEKSGKELLAFHVHHYDSAQSRVVTVDTLDVSVSDFKFNIIDRFPVAEEIHIDSESRITIPLYAFTTPSTQESRYTSVIFIPLDEEGRLHSPASLSMRGVLHARNPYSYRSVKMDDHSYHVTPKGITVSTEVDDEETIVSELVFP